MTDTFVQISREDRYGKTERKNLTLTTEAIEKIQAYAEQHQLYFSVAIETLALIGLGDNTAEALPRLVAQMLERTLQAQFNRFAKLLATAVLAAEAVNYKTDVLLLQTIWREAREAPEDFLQKMLVSMEPTEQPDALVRQIRDEICADAHDEAVVRLRKPWAEIQAILEGEVNDE